MKTGMEKWLNSVISKIAAAKHLAPINESAKKKKKKPTSKYEKRKRRIKSSNISGANIWRKAACGKSISVAK